MSVPLQRDKKYGERLQFTPEELAEQKKAVDARNNRYSEEDKSGRISMGHWVEATEQPAQTSLIIDPPDGQLPPQTALGKEMSAKMGSDWNREVFDRVADFGTWNRCITRGLPEGMFPNPYNNGIQIVFCKGRTIGRVGEHTVLVVAHVVRIRGDQEIVRIISARYALKHERQRYESETQ